MKALHKVGQQFKRVGRKYPYIETVTDVLTTRNLAGDIVKIRYIATHDFCNESVTDYDVIGTTISRGISPTDKPED